MPMRERLRSIRGWMAGAVIASAAASWVSVGYAASDYLFFSRPLGVAAVALVVGSIEVAYLVWTAWDAQERVAASAACAAAVVGSLLVWAGSSGEVVARDFVTIGSGIGLLGLANGLGVLGVFRSSARSTANVATGLVITAIIAYFSSLMWQAAS